MHVFRFAVAALALSLGVGNAMAAPDQTPSVAITIDDLPLVSADPLSPSDENKAKALNKALLAAFSSRHVPATGFVIGRNAESLGTNASARIFAAWLTRGFVLDSHSYSHSDVNDLSIGQVEQEIRRGQTSLAALLPKTYAPRFYRFPYNHLGDTPEKHEAITAFLAASRVKIAACTIDTSDYLFNGAYEFAIRDGDIDTAKRLRDEYVDFTAREIDWYTELNQTALGYAPPHVMLLHLNQLNADTIDRVLAEFEQRHYRFITLADALKDPAYAEPDRFVSKFGPMWGYRWAQARHIKVDGRREPVEPAWIAPYIDQKRSALRDRGEK